MTQSVATRFPILTSLALALASLSACDRQAQYAQDSPDAVITSAVEMVKAGDADRLPALIDADSEAIRATLDRLGRVLGRLQSLSEVLHEKFPQEISQAKNELADQGLGIRMGRQSGSNFGDTWNDALRRLFADPYAWADSASGRLSTVDLSPDTAAILWDERPVLPPFGLTMRLADDGNWYIVAPIQLPIVSRFMPKTDKQWAIVAYLFQAVENTIIDLEDGVRSGELRSLKDVSREAGIMLVAPGAAIAIAYTKTIEEQEQADKPDENKQDGGD